MANYKLLQAAFAKNNVQRFVDVPKLIRAKYQGEKNFKVFDSKLAARHEESTDGSRSLFLRACSLLVSCIFQIFSLV